MSPIIVRSETFQTTLVYTEFCDWKKKLVDKVDKVYWQRRRSCREIIFFFFELITINSADKVRMITDLPSHSYKVYYAVYYAANM